MELFIEQDFPTNTTKFFLRYERGHSLCFVGVRDNQVIEVETERHSAAAPNQIAPLLELPGRLADDFIKLVAEYASKKNIQTENENLLKGKLQATEKHLEDMRKAFNVLIDSRNP